MDKVRLIVGKIKEEDIDRRPTPAQVFYVNKEKKGDVDERNNETNNTNA